MYQHLIREEGGSVMYGIPTLTKMSKLNTWQTQIAIGIIIYINITLLVNSPGIWKCDHVTSSSVPHKIISFLGASLSACPPLSLSLSPSSLCKGPLVMNTFR